MTIQEVAKRVVDEVKLIQHGMRYEPDSIAEHRADELWLLMKDFRSDVVFELVDHFRVAHFVLSDSGAEEEVLRSLLLIHGLLAHRMTKATIETI